MKFRTMNDKKDAQGIILPDVQLINQVGGLVRNASLLELLQLFNIIKGDMSLNGPKPLLLAYHTL